MTIDERLQALTISLELEAHAGEDQRKRIDSLLRVTELHSQQLARDAEHIRALAHRRSIRG